MNPLILVLGILYVLSPIDFIPDVIPVVGWLDDIGVLGYLGYSPETELEPGLLLLGVRVFHFVVRSFCERICHVDHDPVLNHCVRSLSVRYGSNGG